jgi:hypothetical protein
MIDFFVRHGIINASNEPDFVDMVSKLQRQLPLPTAYPITVLSVEKRILDILNTDSISM